MTTSEPPALHASADPKLPKPFRFVLATTAAEGFGDSLARTLMPILAVTVLDYGTGFIGVINSIGLGAFLLLGMPIGMLVDRLRDRRRAMGASSFTRAAALLGLGVAFFCRWAFGANCPWRCSSHRSSRRSFYYSPGPSYSKPRPRGQAQSRVFAADNYQSKRRNHRSGNRQCHARNPRASRPVVAINLLLCRLLFPSTRNSAESGIREHKSSRTPKVFRWFSYPAQESCALGVDRFQHASQCRGNARQHGPASIPAARSGDHALIICGFRSCLCSGSDSRRSARAAPVGEIRATRFEDHGRVIVDTGRGDGHCLPTAPWP